MSKRNSKNYIKRNLKRKIKKTNKHKKKHTISGSLKSAVSFKSCIKSGVNTLVDATFFRNNAKDTTALRMQATVYKKPLISDASVGIIQNFLGLNYKFHCIKCIIDFFNLDKDANSHVATVNVNYHNCRAKDPNDSVQHAKKDCYKYADAILKEASKWVQKGKENDVANKFKDLSLAVRFSAEYISFLLTKKNYPKSLSEESYNVLLSYGVEFANLYGYNPNDKTYKMNKSYLKNCSQETLTILFCYKFVYLAIQ